MSEVLREFPYNKNLCYKILRDKDKMCNAKKSNIKKNMEQFEGLCSSVGLNEDFRIFVDLVLRELQNSTTLEYVFSENLTNEQRKYVHMKCKALGFNSKSQGKEPHRKLRIWRANKTYQKVFHLGYNEEIEEVINNSLLTYNANTRSILHTYRNYSANPQNDQVFGRLCSRHPVSIPKPTSNNLMEFRKQLPVWSKKYEILHLIENNQVLIISSETGSGKTTQIPQFILENACALGDRCKVICTQPRRLSTIAVAERVAAERGEKIGETVGYQIKLETRLGLKSALIYCTNGILLRTLMNSTDNSLKNVTHIIVDEIHERDKYTDFLLISLKLCLNEYPNLKVILMSATADVQLFRSYFQTIKLLDIPGKLFDVQQLFLEDIALLPSDQNGSNGNGVINGSSDPLYHIDVWRSENYSERNHNPLSDALNDCDETYEALKKDMKRAVNKCVSDGLDDSFQQLMMLILSEGGDVNYQDSDTGYTPLMAAAIHGNLEIARQLLHLGADTSLKCVDFTAAQWADSCNKPDARNLINQYNTASENFTQQPHQENLLESYDRTISHEAIDFSLIVKIIVYIHQSDTHGTILVFLPGYDDIINCLQSIKSSSALNMEEFEIFMLHSSMNIKAQHRVFDVIRNKQKIILSTNIAETSITIADVVYVIDTGRAKEKTYDTISGTCSLQTVWISKASVKQRAGRAGRTQRGVCFHLFSRKRYMSMLNNRIPEMLRVPLHELCLQTKLLAPENSKIADYLQLALEPPPLLSVANAIRGLKELGALKEDEELTHLGEHLVQLSVEPRLGKMLIYGVIFKCLDPILTIVACLASKDPFTLPQIPKLKQLATERQKQLTGDSLSDHVAFLRAYQIWQQAELNNKEELVREFYINSATMQTIHETRSQLLSQLRAAGFITTSKPLTVQEANVNSNNWPLIKAVLAVGYYPNVAFGQIGNFATRMEKKVIFHKCSCLNIFTCDRNNCQRQINNYCIIFEELSKIGRHCSVKCGTAVTPLTVALLCGDEVKNFGSHSLTINEYLNFQHGYEKMALFCVAIKAIINRKIANPRYNPISAEEEILNALYQVLSLEERQHELLIQPTGVGLVPKLFSSQLFFNGRRNFNGRQRESRRASYSRRSNYSRNGFAGSSLDTSFTGLNIDNLQLSSAANSDNGATNRIPWASEYLVDNLRYLTQHVNDISSQFSNQSRLGEDESTGSLSDALLNGLNIRSSPSRYASSVHERYMRLGSERLQNTNNENGFGSCLSTNSSTHGIHYDVSALRQCGVNAQSSSTSNRFPNSENLPSAAQHSFASNVNTLGDIRCKLLLEALTAPKLGLTTSENGFEAHGTITSTNSSDIVPLERFDLPQRTAFFIIKPPDYNSFRIGISQGTWVFAPQTEKKVFKSFNQNYFVILFFTICNTEEFHGFATLRATNEGSGNLACPIRWLNTTPISYSRIKTRNLTNSYNCNRLMFQCVDGQEVEYNAGRQLCSMFFEPDNERNFSRAILGSTNK